MIPTTEGVLMSHLIQLKRRIKSIQTTEKITHAMRLIAMSLYSKLEKQNEPLSYYIEHLQKLFVELLEQCPEWSGLNPPVGSPDRPETSKIFLPEDVLDSKPLFIVISATKGFCGGLNNHLFRYIEQKLHIEEHQKPTFITIGKKATAFIEDKNLGEVLVNYHDLNSNNFADIAKNVAQIIMEGSTLHQGSYSSATVYSSIFKNFFAQRPTISSVIPLKPEKSNEDKVSPSETEEESEEKLPPIWEQNSLDIVNIVANQYLNARLTHIMYQALISEYASRFVAMDGATTNAEKYLETLTLQFNKLRQALITREVSELSASL